MNEETIKKDDAQYIKCPVCNLKLRKNNFAIDYIYKTIVVDCVKCGYRMSFNHKEFNNYMGEHSI